MPTGKTSITELLARRTPGPWHWEGIYLRAANGETVIEDRSAGGEYDGDSPDGRLIAAAPELLEAAEAADQALRTVLAFTQASKLAGADAALAALKQLQRVIPKAKGQEEPPEPPHRDLDRLDIEREDGTQDEERER